MNKVVFYCIMILWSSFIFKTSAKNPKFCFTYPLTFPVLLIAGALCHLS